MPTNVKVIHSRDFIRVAPEGHVDLALAEKLLGEIVAAGALLHEFEVLVDTRRMDSALSAADLWFLAQSLARYRGTFVRKNAVLCPFERFDHARLFALCAENQGFNIRAFTDYEEAMDWLTDADKP